LAIVAFLCAACAHAAAVLVPPGLKAGDTYRLVFITDATTTGNDTNIADYNAFVTGEANSNPGLAALNTAWTALLSTNAVNVLDNSGLSPSDSTTLFYHTQGQLLATGVFNGDSGLYDSGDGFDAHGALIYDANGSAPAQKLAWTGTLAAQAQTDFFSVGGLLVVAGDSTTTDGGWSSSDAYPATRAFGVYAVSDTLSVTPEPSTLIICGAALAAFAGRRSKAYLHRIVLH
jgi:hypothetical protein